MVCFISFIITIVMVRTHEVYPVKKCFHTQTVLLATGIVSHHRALELLLCECAWSLSRVQLFATPCTIAHQAPLSMGILQARILKWVAMSSSRTSSQPRDRTQVSCTAGGFFTVWATREALYPLNTFPSTPDSGNPSSVLCLHIFDYFRFLR